MMDRIQAVLDRLDEKDETILRIAAAEFARNGYHNANMDAIANEAGIGKGTLYRRFESKNLLFFTIMVHAQNRFIKSMETLAADCTLEERIDHLFELCVRFAMEKSDLFRMAIHEQSRIMEEADDVSSFVRQMHTRPDKAWEGLVQHALHTGRLVPGYAPGELGILASSLAHLLRGFIFDLFYREGGICNEDEVRQRLAVFRKLLFGGAFCKTEEKG